MGSNWTGSLGRQLKTQGAIGKQAAAARYCFSWRSTLPHEHSPPLASSRRRLMGGHPIAAEAPTQLQPRARFLTHPPPDRARFWKEASRMRRRWKGRFLAAGVGLAGAEPSSQESCWVGPLGRLLPPLLVGVEGAGTQWGSRRHPGSKVVAGARRPPPRGPPWQPP